MQALNISSFASSNTTSNGTSVRTSPTKCTHNNFVLPYLTHFTSACYVADVSPHQCIRLHLVRNESTIAVAKRKSLVNGDVLSSSFQISGMGSTSLTSVLVQLKEDLKLLLDTHVSSVAESINDATVMKRIFFCVRRCGRFSAARTDTAANGLTSAEVSFFSLEGHRCTSVNKYRRIPTGQKRPKRTNETTVNL